MSLLAAWSRAREEGPFAADTALTAAANVLLAALGMVSGILAARLLGPHGRGQLSAIQTGPVFIALLAAMGMPEAVVYYSAKEPDKAGRFLGSAITVSSAAAVPLIILGYFLAPVMLHAQSPSIVRAGRWYLAIVFVLLSEGMMVHPLRGRADFLWWNLMRLMPAATWILVLVVAWAGRRAEPIFVAAGALIAQALLIIPFSGIVRRRVPAPFSPDARECPAMLRYGLPCMMTSVPQTLNLRLDQMLMAALLPPRDLGLYVIAVAWSGAAAPLLNAVSAVTTPAVASAADHGQGARRLATGARGTAALALALCLALEVLTPFAIVFLFGERFRDSIPAALVLVPAAGVLGFNLVLQEGLRGLGRPYAVLKAELAGLAVTAVALAAMLRPMGIMGAAFASLAGYSTVTTVLLLSARRYAATPLTALLLANPAEIQSALGRFVALARGQI
jgi:O-antigen/teichoic acid export membrane protein